MGNVMASGGPMPPPPPPTIAPLSPISQPSTENEPTPTPVTNGSAKDLNPGTMEELHKKTKEIFPQFIEGAKLMVNKGLSSHFNISHSLQMSTMAPTGYRFGVTYVGTKQISPTEMFPIVLGDIDPSGNLNANIIHQLTGNIRCKMAAQVQDNRFTAIQYAADYRGEDFTGSLTVANPDIINSSAVIVGHYLQTVTKKLDLGAELAYQFGPQVPGGQIAVLSLAGKYTGKDWVTSGTIGGTGVHVCYYQRASEQLQLGVEVETNFRIQESTAAIGYQIDLPKANLVFRGMVDSNWTVTGVLEKKLLPLPFTFILSGMVNHTKNESRFGVGLNLG